MERIRELGLDELIAERAASRGPAPRHLPRAPAALRVDRANSAAPRASAFCRARSGHSRPKASRCRTSAGRRCAGSAQIALTAGFGGRDAVLLRPLLRAGPGRPGRRSRNGDLRRALRLCRRPRPRLRRPVPPREVERRRPAPARELRRRLRQAHRRGVILYPAIDIRGGQAVRLVQGDYDRETVYDADPVDAAQALGRARARRPCTSSTSTAPGTASRRTSTRCERIGAGGRVPDPGRRRAARRRLGGRRDLGAGVGRASSSEPPR